MNIKSKFLTIKSRLFITFTVLVVLVVFMSIASIFFGIQNRRFSEKNIFHYTLLSFCKEVHQSLDIESRNLNYYVILGDQNEKDKFMEQSENISKKFEALTCSRSELESWMLEYRNLNKSVNENLRTQSREEMFELFTDKINPNYQSLKSGIEKLIAYHKKTLEKLEIEIKNLNMISFMFSITFGSFAIFIGSLMSVYIFRSISRPLGILQKGTQIIGEGNLDYQININSYDEIGQLAKSFNQMVTNLRNLQLQIIQMDRMSSIGQLAGGVAHEINNPLTGVLGQSQLLLEKLEPDNPYRKTVERIESAAQRCRRIVRALLDFARDKNYSFHEANIDTIINDVLDFTRTELESRKIKLVKNVPHGLPNVKVSVGHIQQVFINIITNAIQAMKQEGKLSITVAIKNNFMEINFTDTGLGIKKENISHVFDPFFTTKDIGQGTGLGLTISYGIIQRHNGQIVVMSEGENKGAAFIVKLPL